MRTLINTQSLPTLQGAPPGRNPMEFHKRLPDYFRTPLIRLPDLARQFGVGEILLKDESRRLGLPAFKILGASWAIWRTLVEYFGCELSSWNSPDELRAQLELLKPLKLVAATDGNHGRGVAMMAKILGFEAHIFVPAGTVEARIRGIESEGAEVTVVRGTYDDAVARASEEQSEGTFLIQDTSWEGYEQVNRWIIEGYSTIFREIEDALEENGIPGPDLVLVQIGVGSLAASVVAHYRRRDIDNAPRIVGVEPLNAACALAAMEAGRVVTLPGIQDSIMAGLNCGTLATVAWPIIRDGIDCFLAIGDDWSRRAMRALAREGVSTSESGAAGLAGLMALMNYPQAESCRQYLNISGKTRILLILTEGVTDPTAYHRIMKNFR